MIPVTKGPLTECLLYTFSCWQLENYVQWGSENSKFLVNKRFKLWNGAYANQKHVVVLLIVYL